MKKVILLFALLFTVSSSFISCRETRNEDTDVEVTDDLDNVDEDIEDAAEDVGDGIEDGVDEVGDEVDEEF